MQKKKTNIWGHIFSSGCFVLLGAACGLFMGMAASAAAESELPFWGSLLSAVAALVAMLLAQYLQIIIHEAGHMCFGLLTGYRFASFRIGGIMLVRLSGKLRLRRLSLAGTGGQCLMIPPDMKDGKYPYVLYHLGGALMNLISVALFLPLYFFTSGNLFLSMFYGMCAVTGAVHALQNGIPLRLGMVNNDGYNAVELGRDNDALRAFWLQLKISEQTTEGVRIKDMPPEWFALPEHTELNNSMIASIAVFRENWLVDKKQFTEAKRLIDELLAIDAAIVGLYRNLLLCDRIYLELVTDRDATLVEKLLSKELKTFMRRMRGYPSVIRTEYVCVRILEGDGASAQKLKNRFAKCDKTFPYATEIESERELIDFADTISA